MFEVEIPATAFLLLQLFQLGLDEVTVGSATAALSAFLKVNETSFDSA